MELKTLQCKRCGHIFMPRIPNPQRCPACGSRLWKKEKKGVNIVKTALITVLLFIPAYSFSSVDWFNYWEDKKQQSDQKQEEIQIQQDMLHEMREQRFNDELYQNHQQMQQDEQQIQEEKRLDSEE